VLELGYCKVADRFNIIDKPNERSSHKRIVLRGGGIIFTIALWIWSIWSGFEYPWLLAGVTLAAGVSFGQAHRKHAYQLMANELKLSHVTVSLIYMGLQLAISLGYMYLIPNTIVAHWVYLVAVALVLAVAYVLFKMKYYHLHEEYLASLKK